MATPYTENTQYSSHATWSKSPPEERNLVLKQTVDNYAKRANALAKELLNEKKVTETSSENLQPVIIRHYYYPWFSEPQPAIYVINNNTCSTKSSGSRSSGRSKSNGGEALALVLATAAVIGGIAIYYVGAANGRIEDAKNELEDTQKFQDKVKPYLMISQGKDKELASHAMNLSELKKRICTRIKESAEADKQYRITLLSGVALSALGGLAGYFGYLSYPAASSTAVYIGVSPGALLGVVSVGYMLYKSGLDNNQNTVRQDASSLRNAVKELKALNNS